MDLASLMYRGLYDSLATIDLAGGVLLAAIWFQTGYVALFRAVHGPDAGREPAPPPTPRTAAARRASAASPWGRR